MRALAIGILGVVGLLVAGQHFVGSGHARDMRPEFDAGLQALTTGDYAEAYCRWRPLAERGFAEAQYHLGWLYANGNGLAVSIEQALDWWTRAAAQGHADAQFAVALAYTTGEGIKKDLAEALKWYLAAARAGHEDAREILVQLGGEPDFRLLETYPEIAGEDWFGWQARVRGERINVRGGPGTNHKIVGQLTQGTRLRVVGQRGDWYMVVMPDAEAEPLAWIYKTLLSRESG